MKNNICKVEEIMGKIGRNDPCPCGSGNKYKKCCLAKVPGVPAQTGQSDTPSIKTAVEHIQQAASEKKNIVRALGVFILFSTVEGDAWLLEVTDMDCVQVAAGGSPITVEIDENPETIEINWTHRFAIKNKKFTTTAYADEAVATYDTYPAHSIRANLKKIISRIPPDMMRSIHVEDEESEAVS